jgi:hypothetical protein
MTSSVTRTIRRLLLLRRHHCRPDEVAEEQDRQGRRRHRDRSPHRAHRKVSTPPVPARLHPMQSGTGYCPAQSIQPMG